MHCIVSIQSAHYNTRRRRKKPLSSRTPTQTRSTKGADANVLGAPQSDGRSAQRSTCHCRRPPTDGYERPTLVIQSRYSGVVWGIRSGIGSACEPGIELSPRHAGGAVGQHGGSATGSTGVPDSLVTKQVIPSAGRVRTTNGGVNCGAIRNDAFLRPILIGVHLVLSCIDSYIGQPAVSHIRIAPAIAAELPLTCTNAVQPSRKSPTTAHRNRAGKES